MATTMADSNAYGGLTCISCRLVFGTPDGQREHYRSDWHRYNVKRQVTGLPPVSFDDYKAKEELFVEATPSSSSEALYCLACRKTFQSKNAYMNHQKSRKHTENVTLLDIVESEASTVVPTKAQLRKEMEAKLDAPPEDEGEGEGEVAEDEEDGEGSDSGSWHTVDSSDDEDEEAVLLEDAGDSAFLYLPSGAMIGHRSLFRYFRQRLKPVDTVAIQQGNSSTLRELRFTTKRLKALGWTGTTGQLAVQKARDVKFLRRIAGKYQLKNGVNTNRLFVSRGRWDQQ